MDTRYARINIIDAGLNSWYNGLALQLNKRMSKGLTGSVAYTWSHAIDEGQGGAGTPNIFASGGPQTLRSRRLPRGKGHLSLDIRQRLVVSAVYSPVFTHNTGAVAKHLVNGWQLSVLGTYSTPPPATPTVTVSALPVPAPFTAANTGTLERVYFERLRRPCAFPADQQPDVDQMCKDRRSYFQGFCR